MPSRKIHEQEKRTQRQETLDTISQIDRKHQQRLLDCFSSAFSEILSSDRLTGLLQQIKQALFHRNFAEAFGKEDLLHAYAARWSPTRALCYDAVFQRIDEHMKRLAHKPDAANDEGPDVETLDGDCTAPSNDDKDILSAHPMKTRTEVIRMVSIGGCAAEQAAFASYLRTTCQDGSLVLLDIGPWEQPTSLLQVALTTPPKISKYASASVKAANCPLLREDQLSLTLEKQDALELNGGKIKELVSRQRAIVTLMFTLNELYTSGGVAKTTKLLRTLGESLVCGSLLLVVDSPGSYSEAAIGKEKKTYPMQWLLDHTLMEKNPEGRRWEKLSGQDSIWFRLAADLSYPMQLENMRYQVHLYRIDKKIN